MYNQRMDTVRLMSSPVLPLIAGTTLGGICNLKLTTGALRQIRAFPFLRYHTRNTII